MDSSGSVAATCRRLAADLGDAQAWQELAHLLESPACAALPSDAEDWKSAHELFKETVWREIRAFWRAGASELPYLMYRPVPNYASDCVSFDDLGMRRSMKAGAPVVYEDFLSTPLRRGVVIGNSASAGVGVSGDAATLASVLNQRMPDTVWFNLSIGGHGLLQNAIALDLLAPDRFDYLVICGGLIDYLAPLTAVAKTPHFPAYIAPHQSEGHSAYDIAANGWSERDLARTQRRAVEMMADRATRGGARTLFMLQPHLALTSKVLAPAECCMTAVYERTADRPVWKAHTKMAPYRQQIISEYAAVCAAAGIDFRNANDDPRFTAADWLYLDYIHVNDPGHVRMAGIVTDWITPG